MWKQQIFLGVGIRGDEISNIGISSSSKILNDVKDSVDDVILVTVLILSMGMYHNVPMMWMAVLK